MDQELKKKWIEALRSGQYAQCRGGLRIGDQFCCLGVLADVIDPTAWSFKSIINWKHHETSLAGDFLSNEIQDKLMCMNDTDRKSFNQIADYIEKNL